MHAGKHNVDFYKQSQATRFLIPIMHYSTHRNIYTELISNDKQLVHDDLQTNLIILCLNLDIFITLLIKCKLHIIPSLYTSITSSYIQINIRLMHRNANKNMNETLPYTFISRRVSNTGKHLF